jgi:branched-chain amino acid transport system ATP-binding protein
VLDTVIVGALLVEKTVAAARGASLAIVRKLGLEAKANQPAATLTLSDRKRLEVARALATRPRLLLLDEVMAGLRPTECDQLVEVFRDLNRSDGLTILLIEHVMRAVMALAQHIGVLDRGEIIASGSPDEVVKNPAVLQCYLGEDAEI